MKIKPKILIVDDKRENLIALKKVLKEEPVEIVEALSGNEALKATLYNDFALALLDIQMPEMDGYELAGILREEEKTSGLPFIFISAVYTDNLNVFKGYEKGAFSFITKPFQPEILINKVRFFVEKHQQEIALQELNQTLVNKNSDLEFVIRELESFSYSVSHDLRTPLRAIDGYANILVQDHGDKLDEDGKRVLKVISENAIKMSKLIDSLLTFSKLGKRSLMKKTVNADLLIKEILDETQHEKKENIELRIGKLTDFYADHDLIKQVLINLISNAIKYSGKEKKPMIEIGNKEINGELIYFIKDNGAGFDMKYKDKLFGVFQRLHDANEFEGVGIGLANVKRIITAHGGKVWAESEIGKGATFYFNLPKD